MATVLAFDYGERRVGVAIGDLQLRIAHPLGTIDSGDPVRLEEKLRELVDEWSPVKFVVGMPEDLRGGEHALSPNIKEFGQKINILFEAPVIFINESYTSVEAESCLKSIGLRGLSQKKHLDPIAAKTILEDFFMNYE